MVVPFDEELGVTSQSEGFTRYRRGTSRRPSPDAYPLLLHYPYYLLYSSQVVKQADLVLRALRLRRPFTLEQKRRDFTYYEPITVRDSSLSASIQAIVAAEVGHVELAYEYFRETALVDLRDLAGNTGHGVHLASLAGAWLVAVAGFGGLRDYGDVLSFAPTLPSAVRRLAFGLLYRQRRFRVELLPGRARYTLLDGEPLDLLHHGASVKLEVGVPMTLAWDTDPPVPESIRPPKHREPSHEGVGAEE